MTSHLTLLLVGVKGERTVPYPVIPSARHVAAIIIPAVTFPMNVAKSLFEMVKSIFLTQECHSHGILGQHPSLRNM